MKAMLFLRKFWRAKCCMPLDTEQYSRCFLGITNGNWSLWTIGQKDVHFSKNQGSRGFDKGLPGWLSCLVGISLCFPRRLEATLGVFKNTGFQASFSLTSCFGLLQTGSVTLVVEENSMINSTSKPKGHPVGVGVS